MKLVEQRKLNDPKFKEEMNNSEKIYANLIETMSNDPETYDDQKVIGIIN